jgi:gamma-glutamylcyclotransferase (GGCT)/AIG2-like uncharacterized protein YtfP
MAHARAPRHLLFVYGSLKRGQRNHAQLRGAPFVGAARTLPEYRLLDLGTYPALARGSRAIHGELFEVEFDLLLRLDWFEGNAYVRRVVRLADGRSAITYFAVDAVAARAVELEADSWPPTSHQAELPEKA